MKRNPVLVIAFTWFFAAVAANAGDVTVSVNNEGSLTEHAVTVHPGDTFRIDVTVSTKREIFDVFRMALSAGKEGVLSVTGGVPVDPWTVLDSIPFGVIDPASGSFGVVLPCCGYFGPGESALLTLEIAVDKNIAPGVYTLNVIDAVYSECRECPAFSFAGSGPDFIVEAVAGPAIPAVSEWGIVVMVLSLLTAGTILLGRARRAPPASRLARL